MKKKVLFLSLYIATTSILVSAVDVNIPGANPHIDKDAYKTYMYTNQDYNNLIDSMINNSIKRVEGQIVSESTPAKESLNSKDEEKLHYARKISEAFKTISTNKTYINIHPDEYKRGIRLTIPTAAVVGATYTESKEKYKLYDYSTPIGEFLLGMQNKTYENGFDYMNKPIADITTDDIRTVMIKAQNRNSSVEGDSKFTESLIIDPKTVRGGPFKYGKLDNSYWDIVKGGATKEKVDLYLMTLNFSYGDAASPRYHIGIAADKHYKHDMENLLVNYILPSIEDLEVDSIDSKRFLDDDFTYNVINGVPDYKNKGISFKIINENGFEQEVVREAVKYADEDAPYGLRTELSKALKNKERYPEYIKKQTYHIILYGMIMFLDY